MKRLLLVAGLLVLVAVGAIVWFVRFSLDGRVKAAIEEHGSAMALAPVRVEGVHIDLRGGRSTIRGIAVANPEGFPAGTAVSLSGITIEIEPGSLRGSPIVVPEIRVGQPRVHVVMNTEGRMNVEKLRRNIADYPDRLEADQPREERAGGGARPSQPGTEPASERRVRVGELTIEEGVVTIDASALGRQQAEELPLGSVELRDVGGERGATPEQIGRRVSDALIARTARAVAGAELKRALRDKGGEIGEKLGELLQKGIDR